MTKNEKPIEDSWNELRRKAQELGVQIDVRWNSEESQYEYVFFTPLGSVLGLDGAVTVLKAMEHVKERGQ